MWSNWSWEMYSGRFVFCFCFFVFKLVLVLVSLPCPQNPSDAKILPFILGVSSWWGNHLVFPNPGQTVSVALPTDMKCLKPLLLTWEEEEEQSRELPHGLVSSPVLGGDRCQHPVRTWSSAWVSFRSLSFTSPSNFRDKASQFCIREEDDDNLWEDQVTTCEVQPGECATSSTE